MNGLLVVVVVVVPNFNNAPVLSVFAPHPHFVTCQNCFEFPSNPEWKRIPPDNHQVWMVVCHDWSWLILLDRWTLYDILEMWFRSFTCSRIHWSLPIESGPSLSLVVGWLVVGWLTWWNRGATSRESTNSCVYIYIYITIIIVMCYGLGWYQCMVYPPNQFCFRIRCIFCCASIYTKVKRQ